MTATATKPLFLAIPIVNSHYQCMQNTTALKILLVEDYAANILVATTILEEFGHICDVAQNGKEALERFDQQKYDVILMDVQMHEMDGFETTSHIRIREARKNLPRTPIIAMTAHALTGDRERCLDSGMDDYISKPFDADILKQKLLAITTEAAAS